MRPGEPKDTTGLGSLAKAMLAAQPYIDASWQLVGSIGLLAFAGWWLDRKFGTSPWLLLSGAVFGLGVGMYTFIRRVLELAENEKKARESGDASTRKDEKNP